MRFKDAILYAFKCFHQKSKLLPFLFAFIILSPLTQTLAKSKDTPQLSIIRKCLSVMDMLNSAQVILDGYYHDNSGKKVSIDFDGVVKFPGDVDGKLKFIGGSVERDGQFRTVDGKTFYLASDTKDWIKLEPNRINLYEQNQFFKAIYLILKVCYYPEYLTGKIAHDSRTFQDKQVDYLSMNIDIAKIHADSKKSSQFEQLKYFSGDLTGKKTIAEMWIEKSTGYLLKLSISVDGYGKSAKPLSLSITLSNYNLNVVIEKPGHF